MIRREQDGWLPDPVQRIANAAFHCGLVPLVEAKHPRSISLRDGEDRQVGVVVMVGPGIVLYFDVEGGADTIEDMPGILAWLSRTTGRYAS